MSCRDCLQLRRESVEAYNALKEQVLEAVERVNKLESHVRTLNKDAAQSPVPHRLAELESKVRKLEQDLD